jgi:hypothetical protein
MDPQILLTTLEAFPSTGRFVEEQLLGGIPWIFDRDAASFRSWRSEVASAAKLDSDSVYLVGSAATGYSLSPRKAGRPFKRIGANNASDIDIAVVDSTLFALMWNTIVAYDRNRTLLSALAESSNRPLMPDRISRVRLQVYWGTVSSSDSLPGTTEAQRLRSLFAATSRREPFLGHAVRARVYRRRRDLIAYHVQSLQQVIETLKQRRADH